jgi:O-antigen/teichoic acid export membrane protein
VQPDSPAPGTARQTLRLIKDSLVYSPARLVPALVSFVWLVAFTRLFTAEEYGQYSVIIAVSTVIGALFLAWIKESALRLLPRYDAQGERSRFLAQAARMLIVGMGVMALVGVAVWPLRTVLLGDFSRFFAVAALLVVAEALYTNLQTMLSALRKTWAYTVAQVLFSLLRIGLALTLVLAVEHDIASLLLGTAVAYLVADVVMARALGYGPRLLPARRTDRVLWRSAAAYGVPLVGFLLVAQLLQVSDRILLLVLRDATEAGIYASNYNLAWMGLGLLSAPVVLAAHPLIVRQWEGGGRDTIQATITAFTRLHLLLLLPAVVFTGVFAREIAALALGEEFRGGYLVLPIVAPGLLAWHLANYGRKGLELREETRTLLLMAVVCLVVNAVGNVLLLPRYGYPAAAWTTRVAFTLYPLLVGWQSRSHLVWRFPWRAASRIGLAAAAAGGIPAAVKWGWFGGQLPLPWFLAAAATGVLIYALVVWWLGELRALRG